MNYNFFDGIQVVHPIKAVLIWSSHESVKSKHKQTAQTFNEIARVLDSLAFGRHFREAPKQIVVRLGHLRFEFPRHHIRMFVLNLKTLLIIAEDVWKQQDQEAFKNVVL